MMKLTIAFLLVAFGISAILPTPAPVPKKLKNDWAQHKVFFTPEKEAARRKASVHVPIAMAYKPTTMKPPATAAPVNQNAWVQHKAKFHLKFNSTKEEAFRKVIFAQTDAMILKHNSDPTATYQMAHNEFSTMTEEEKIWHMSHKVDPIVSTRTLSIRTHMNSMVLRPSWFNPSGWWL